MPIKIEIFDTSAKRHDVPARIFSALTSDRERKDEHRAATRGQTIPMSSAGKCVRMLWARFHGVPEQDPPRGRTLAIFGMGDCVEDEVYRLLRLAGFEVEDVDPETGSQFRCVSHDGQVTGRTDGTIMLDGVRTLLEVKSANSRSFAEFKQDGMAGWRSGPVYGPQMTMYMGHQGLSQGLMVVYSKETSDVSAELVQFDADEFERLQGNLDVAVGDDLPERPAGANGPGSKFCKWCPVGQWCYSPERSLEDAPAFDPANPSG